jgi:lysophospholipase L1-like esterase
MIWNEILCLGDSITYGARDQYGRSPTVELSRVMKEETGEIYICHNHGVSGDTSADLLRRTWGACNSSSRSNIATIMIGTNDTQKSIPPSIYKDNLLQIIDICKIHGMNPIISTLPKIGFTPLYYRNSRLIKDYNEIIERVSGDLGIILCDMAGIEKYYVDGVHFYNEGHKEIARRWASTIFDART